MKRMLVLFLLTVVAVSVFAQEAKTAFNWAFVKRAADGTAAPIDFRERVNVSPGELFKIYILPIKGAYVYLYLHDAGGDLQQLFPSSFGQFDKPTYLSSRFYVPEGDSWFTLDNAKGTERFYLIASLERLSSLETLELAYEKSSGSGKETAKQAVLDEIARIRSQHSQLAMAAEKPVTVAGGTRGINAAVEKVATRIEAPGFYYKLFRLEH